MGNLCSGPAAHVSSPAADALAAVIVRAEALADGAYTPFNKVLLQSSKRFGGAFGGPLKQSFLRHAQQGQLSSAAAAALLAEVGGGTLLAEPQLATLYEAGGLKPGEALSFRTFLLVLACGYVLSYVPLAGPGVDPLVRLDVGSARAASTSFSQAEALEREGDTSAAAAAAAAAAAEVHLEVAAADGVAGNEAAVAEGVVASEAAATGIAASEAAAATTPALSLAPSSTVDPLAIAAAIDLVFHAFAALDTRRQGYIYREDLEAALGSLAEATPAAIAHRRASVSGDAAAAEAATSQEEGAATAADATPAEAAVASSPPPRPTSAPRPVSTSSSSASSHLTFLALGSRWKELDFNADGRVSFAEFFLAFLGWVGVRLSSEDEDDEDEDSGEATPGSRRGSRVSRRRSSVGSSSRPTSRRGSTTPKA